MISITKKNVFFRSQKSCRVLVEMDTDALPIPSLAVFSSQNRTTATPSNDNRSITVNLKKYAPQTVVAAMSPLGSVAFILDDAVYNKCKSRFLVDIFKCP